MPAKRIILMYISQVSGHRSAAMAIEAAIRKLSPEAQILSINAFNYTNPISEKIINHLYIGVVSNAPQIWDYLYDNPKILKRIAKIKQTVHKFNSPKLKKLFDEFCPDVVACTQAFPCGMVADFKKIYDSKITLVAVLTDFVPHSYWIYDTVDFYIAPSDEVMLRLKAKGIPEEKIRPFGIPFDQKFNEAVEKNAILTNLGLDLNLPTILVMGGGHGLGPMPRIVKCLQKAKNAFQEIIIAGVNHKLYQALSRDCEKYKQKIVLLEFVNNIHELMSIADIIITKPGGITTAEALAKKLPMVIIQPLPGQEASNTAYLTKEKAAIKVDNLNELSIVVDDLLLHQEKLNALRQAAGAISKPNASMDVARLLLS